MVEGQENLFYIFHGSQKHAPKCVNFLLQSSGLICYALLNPWKICLNFQSGMKIQKPWYEQSKIQEELEKNSNYNLVPYFYSSNRCKNIRMMYSQGWRLELSFPKPSPRVFQLCCFKFLYAARFPKHILLFILIPTLAPWVLVLVKYSA